MGYWLHAIVSAPVQAVFRMLFKFSPPRILDLALCRSPTNRVLRSVIVTGIAAAQRNGSVTSFIEPSSTTCIYIMLFSAFAMLRRGMPHILALSLCRRADAVWMPVTAHQEPSIYFKA